MNMPQRHYIIAGNWKMFGTKQSVSELLQGVRAGVAAMSNKNLTWIVFPPFVYLETAQKLLAGSSIAHGAQDLATEKEGAFTGEVSASMLKEFGCQYALVGHSERRSYYHETDEIVAAKFLRALEAGIKPILCVGETLSERESGQAEAKVAAQIDAVVKKAAGNADIFAEALIAYEPIWAIGTGVSATPQEAQKMHAYIRQYIKKYDANIAEKLNILYGGSLKSANAREIFAMPDINGGLIGGASLKAAEFLAIGKQA